MTEKKTKTKTKPQEDSSQVAYHGIRRMLYAKELVPGQKIAYRDLAERLELSPTPIVQALKWLELQGFVLHEPNRGYSMAPFSLNEIEELYELRELIEPSLIPATIKRIDKKGLGELKVALQAHLSAEREYYLKERLFKNREFHMTLASLSGKETPDPHTPERLRHAVSQVWRQLSSHDVAHLIGPGASGNIRCHGDTKSGKGADRSEEPPYEREGPGPVLRQEDTGRTGTL